MSREKVRMKKLESSATLVPNGLLHIYTVEDVEETWNIAKEVDHSLISYKHGRNLFHRRGCQMIRNAFQLRRRMKSEVMKVRN